MQFWIRIQLINFDADPNADSDPGNQNDADPSGSGSTTPVIRYNLAKLQYITCCELCSLPPEGCPTRQESRDLTRHTFNLLFSVY
jgi:hypothetical protein